MAGLLDSIWPYIPPGFRQALFGGDDYTQAQPSPGLPPNQIAPRQGGLLGPLMEMSPGADIRDAVNYSGAASNAFRQGNIGQGLLDMAYIPAALAGTLLPGSASQYRQAGGAVADALEAAPRRIEDPIKAYHGSPHDFDRFELSDKTIGTGEGAQAYGHGLYFAENEGVAREYRDALSPRPAGNEMLSSAFTLRSIGEDVGASLRRMYPNATDAEIDAAVLASEKTPGSMYEVAIHADPKEFVDFDPSLLGKESELKASGVPGFRYLDQGSRGAGTGTSNYVVFDDKLIEILRKYGLLGPMLGGAAGGLLFGGGDDQAY